MSKCYFNRRDRAFKKPKNTLRSIELMALSIRKLLLKLKPVDTKARREIDDAVKLAIYIERIASQAVGLAAANANACVDLLEILLLELGDKLDCIFTSDPSVR
ncbi:MAG: hypothetical protein ABSH16_06350 [Sedimentisphaerales bacterium]